MRTTPAAFLLALASFAQAADPMNDPNRPVAQTASLPASQAAAAMKLPPGFSVQVVAHEPEVVQPVAMATDDRGRIWVLENSNYPKCPGEPRDRILILEDADGDGRAEKTKVFYDKLTFSTGIQVGFGGVWVGAPPNLLFFPDKNGDDVPDGEPEKVLDGWGWEDTHETLNNFVWGPDGWLYGTQGVFTNSKVGKPGTPDAERIPINAGVFRYHPTRRVFERYSEGGSNQWGIDWNDRGQAFFAACVIPHIWQCVQGARYQRQAGKHFDPNTYDDIKTIGSFEYEKRAYCGAMMYLGDLFPKEFRDTFFFNDVHMNKIRNEVMVRSGSGYKAKRNLDFLVANDGWFRGLQPQLAPDGSMYLNDWYDKVPCYQQRAQVDRGNGRIYKITYEGAKHVPVDLAKLSDAELVQLQLHANDWHVRHARRILQERGPKPEVHAALAAMARDHQDETRRLRAIWALQSTGGFTDAIALEKLRDASEYVRGWTIQLACESGKPSDAVLAAMAEMASSETSALVRLYIASGTQRLAVAQRWPILQGLVSHAGDEKDHNLPLMVWYAAEPAVAADPAKAADLLGRCKLGKVQEYIARRMAALAVR